MPNTGGFLKGSVPQLAKIQLRGVLADEFLKAIFGQVLH
jgi:hypothetical protein